MRPPTTPYIDTWRRHDARYEQQYEKVERTLDLSEGVLPLDVAGVRAFVAFLGDMASNVVNHDWTAERFTEEVLDALMRDDPLFPRMAGILYLDSLIRDELHTADHLPAVRADLDQIAAERLRDVIRSDPDLDLDRLDPDLGF